MPEDKKLFTVTQWVLRAALVGLLLLLTGLGIGAVGIVYAWHSGALAAGLASAARGAIDSTVSIGGWHGILTAADVAEITPTDVVRMSLAGLAGVAMIFVLVGLILRAILRVVVSASVGDPFNAKNADDIVRTAWLLLGVYGAEVLTALAVTGFTPAVVRAKLHGGIDVPFYGLFVVLLMFVLARIFRRGTEMRAELEGTV